MLQVGAVEKVKPPTADVDAAVEEIGSRLAGVNVQVRVVVLGASGKSPMGSIGIDPVVDVSVVVVVAGVAAAVGQLSIGSLLLNALDLTLLLLLENCCLLKAWPGRGGKLAADIAGSSGTCLALQQGTSCCCCCCCC